MGDRACSADPRYRIRREVVFLGPQSTQLPMRVPCFLTTFTRRIPEARSGLRNPQSAASCAAGELPRGASYGGRRIVSLFEADPITSHHRFVESKPRLRAIPVDELANCVIVGPLRATGA
jgi:hypothetical protein